MAIVQRTEELILNQLIYNEDYFRKVFPYLKRYYFQERIESLLFDVIADYSKKYNIPPSVDTISLLINEKAGINGDEIGQLNTYITELLAHPADFKTRFDFIVQQTETFCQEKAMYSAILDSMSIINGDDKKRDKNAIPEIMKEALKVSFDQSIGLDYDDVEERYERLHARRNKIKFDVEALNIITKDGLENKTLNCVLASTGVGKTIFMCHCAASAISQGKNVLYITMEMAEEKIAERIDANLMDVELDDFDKMDKPTFLDKFKKVMSSGGFLRKLFGFSKQKLGKLIIKEFPTGAGNANHFRFLLDELELKKGFRPDFIIIDYINICSSTRILPMAGSYAFIKAIAEELRGLAVEYDVPILTGTQTNRGGFSNSDVEMTDTSESIGLPQTLDLYIALMTNDTLEKAGRIAVKQLKNRYRDFMKNRYFSIGLDKPKMRFFHVEDWNKNIHEEEAEDKLRPASIGDEEGTELVFKKPEQPPQKARFEGVTI